MRFIPALFLFSVSTLTVVSAQSNSTREKQITAKATQPTQQVSAQAASATPRNPNAVDEQQALRDDLKKMRLILGQMEANLAFVDSSPSPLKHQFQLEIDMWRALIGQMERRLQSGTR